MCGLCGEIRFDHKAPSLEALARMSEVLRPRGPDGSGMFRTDSLAVGHRRLKIIDLSDHAQQPMIDSQLGLGIVYNGAIYNYRELRQELSARGHRFFSSGDTEVVLKSYAEWGDACVERFHGMFAFALWERDSGRLVLARDRLGIKPLYYAELDGGLRFASSLPALLAAGGIDTDIDPVALHHYMSFHSVVPAPYTLLRGVRKLPPATLMTVEADGRRSERVWWRLDYAHASDARGFDEWRDGLGTALKRAVRRRLVADVPVGVLLSGGLDSSLIVGLLAEEGQHGIHTFSVGFEDVADEDGNEFHYSDIIADTFATDHHRIFVDSRELLEQLAPCIAAMSEPMVSHDVIGFYLLSRKVAEHVKVVQSGQGADEVLGGYHWYPPMLESRNPLRDYARVFFDRDDDEYREAVDPRFHGDDHSLRFVESHFAQPGAGRAIDRTLRLDTTVMLVDDPVKRVDNMTMAWGLEARVPFLDHELVEYAARMPAEYKVADGGKHVLKELARRHIPAEVIDRPKGYFPVPQLKYMQGPYLELAHDVLGGGRARERGLFRPDHVERLLEDPAGHITPLRGSKLWQIVLLEYWLQVQGV
jgi:asparagine synthase (glutamine-hydrolysing)